jgi:5-hydroxyisourate hydrolase-like protein (transthyretin family)
MRSLMFETETIDFCDLARVLTLSLLTIPLLSYGSTVTGIVTNKTTGKPAAGDSVVLIGLTSNMQEISRTKTNAAGHYSIEVPEVGMHLIRVDHQKAAYFAAVAPGATNADVVVYDVATRVPGITTDAEVLRVETDPQGLHVTQSYLVGNSSSPPRTQFGTASYEIYLPAGVQPEQPIAMGPGGMPVASSPVPAADKGHYAFIFPVRPGQTQFQVSYHLPYTGSYTFHSRVSLPTANFSIILPKGMKFEAGPVSSFQPTSDEPNVQTFATKAVKLSQGTDLCRTRHRRIRMPKVRLQPANPAHRQQMARRIHAQASDWDRQLILRIP